MKRNAPEIWGGVECTFNRVGERYFDQLEKNRHKYRLDDLDLFAQIGIKAIRYPFLWEHLAPEGPDKANWAWAEARLSRLRELAVAPIAGFVHHGSGPRHTSLLDENFATQLAQYAEAFARKFPFVGMYTPVNEPLTTARFSGLYGHWYPHACETAKFLRMVVNQCKATKLAMRKIRQVNPDAKFVLTEDLGEVFSTPLLSYQAEFENQRRWLSMDLLCGKVDPHHPLYNFLIANGLSDCDVLDFQDDPCIPDVIGINHYITSDRFLDEDLAKFPTCAHGGNGKHRYADVEAVRIRAEGPAGFTSILRQAWARYERPLAITEVHLGGSREEQMRWFAEAYAAARDLRADGVPVQAVTAWAMLGSFDWNRLVTVETGFYEPGLFDVRSERPRLTGLGKVVRAIAHDQMLDDPVLESPGWWKRPMRILYPHHSAEWTEDAKTQREGGEMMRRQRRILAIIGANGTLGRAFSRIAEIRGIECRSFTRKEIDIGDAAAVDEFLEQTNPWAVINAAGYVRVDEAEKDADRCFRDNTHASHNLAIACERKKTRLVTFSSDLVFDGKSRQPYKESSAANPINTYGRSKAEAETRVLQTCEKALVVRTSAFFGPWDEHNFVTITLRNLHQGGRVVAAEDLTVSPTYVPDLVHASLDLLMDGEVGIWHLANRGESTWLDLARATAEIGGFDKDLIEGLPAEALGLPAPRPRYSVLGTERGAIMPALDDALSRYLMEQVSVPCKARY